jgi:hypothetical protein
MTVDKPQVGRKETIDTTKLEADPDWVFAPLGAMRFVTLSDGTKVKFEKTIYGWNARDLTKKERKQQNMHKPTTTTTTWCASCKYSHQPGQHKAGTTTPTVNTSTYQSTWHDHDGLTLVWECKNGAKLYGASKYGLKNASHNDLVVDMAGNIKCNFVQNAPAKYDVLKKYVKTSGPKEVINLDWDDYGLPPVTFRFWETLLSLVEGKDVTFTCIGGHGRTGTALASLMVADGVLPTVAMRHIWRVYCEKAIETASQENYVLTLGGQDQSDLDAVLYPNKVNTDTSALPLVIGESDGKPLHSVHCKCTECLTKRVADLARFQAQDAAEEAAADALAIAEYNRQEAEATAGQTYMFGASNQDEEYAGYQNWAREHGIGNEAYNW